MANWHPDAIRVLGRHAGTHAPDAAAKIVPHTTEGSSAAGAIGAYRSHGGWPHFTLEWTGSRLRIYQHLPLNVAARALVNGPEPGETNRAKAIQVELVGFAANSEKWSEQHYTAIASVFRWIEKQTGCPPQRLPGTVWGTDHPPRVSGMAFHRGRGHAGHQHVPGNSHWDPGQFRIDLVLDVDDSAHRLLRGGERGPDVRALQRAVRARAGALGIRDHRPTPDGVYGPETRRDAAAVAYLLGLGKSRKQIVQNGLSVNEQRLIRHPGRRTKTMTARAWRRRKATKETT